MDDDKQYTIQIKGTAYRFRPIPPDDLAKVLIVVNMGASITKPIKALMSALAASAGPEQWDAITDRLIANEITVEDISSKLFKKLVERQKEDGAQ